MNMCEFCKKSDCHGVVEFGIFGEEIEVRSFSLPPGDLISLVGLQRKIEDTTMKFAADFWEELVDARIRLEPIRLRKLTYCVLFCK